MAHTQRDLKGWQFKLGEETSDLPLDELNPPQTPTRRARRGISTTDQTKITLTRESDDLQVSAGDTILVLQKGGSSQVALVKNISLGLYDFIEMRVLWFLRIGDVQPSDLPKEPEYAEPASLNSNELFLTSYEEDIKLTQIVCKVNVVLRKELEEDIILDDSIATHTFMVQRACNSHADMFSDKFDYRELYALYKSDPDQFTAFIRESTIPAQYKSLPLPKKLATVVSSVAKRQDERSQSLSPSKRYSQYLEDSLSSSYDSSDSDLRSDSDSDSDSLSDSDIVLPQRTKRKYTKRAANLALSTPRKSNKQAGATSPRKLAKTSSTASPGYLERMRSLVELKSFKTKPEAKPPSLPLSPRKSKAPGNMDNAVTSEAFKEIKARLHASSQLCALRGRETESDQILAKLATAIESETGCCIYVSGTPGVGKTATVRNVIDQLRAYADEGAFKKFGYLEINGLKLLSPNVAYQQLCKHLLGVTVSPSNAVKALTNFFDKELPDMPQVVLMDELDQMVTKSQKLMYNFFNWPSIATSKLIVVAVANTMDLPERVLTNKISSRLGLNRIQFVGYSHEQLSDIIKHRLDSIEQLHDLKVTVMPDAIVFASRKIASVSGDARRALTICRRAVEIAEKQLMANESMSNSRECFVTVAHINQAINETINSPVALYLSSLPFASKLFLHALVLRMTRSGLMENSLGDIIDEMQNALKLMTSKEGGLALDSLGAEYSLWSLLYEQGFAEATSLRKLLQIRPCHFNSILAELMENGVLVQQNTSSERHRMIAMHISKEEVMAVLKRDKFIVGML